MNLNNLDSITNALQTKISALQEQYLSFVDYCKDLIRMHRIKIESELKSDPNTPRDLLNLVYKHGESLEKKILIASTLNSTININEKNLERYKSQRIIECNDRKSVESTRINGKKIRNNQARNSIQLEKVGINEKADEKIAKLKKKIRLMKVERNDKDEKFQSLVAQLEKIKKMQEISLNTLKFRCSSGPQKTPLSLSVSRDSSSINIGNINLSSIKPDESEEFPSFFQVLKEKLTTLQKKIKNFTDKGFEIEGIITQSPKLSNIKENLQIDREEIEKTIEAIINLRFQESKTDNDIINSLKRKIKDLENDLAMVAAEKTKAENEIFELRKFETKLKDSKNFDSKVINFNYRIEKENNALKIEIRSLRMANENYEKNLKTLQENLKKNEKKMRKNSKILKNTLSITQTSEFSIKGHCFYKNLKKDLLQPVSLNEKAIKVQIIDLPNLNNKDIQTQTTFEILNVSENRKILGIYDPKELMEKNLNLTKKISELILEKKQLQEELLTLNDSSLKQAEISYVLLDQNCEKQENIQEMLKAKISELEKQNSEHVSETKLLKNDWKLKKKELKLNYSILKQHCEDKNTIIKELNDKLFTTEKELAELNTEKKNIEKKNKIKINEYQKIIDSLNENLEEYKTSEENLWKSENFGYEYKEKFFQSQKDCAIISQKYKEKEKHAEVLLTQLSKLTNIIEENEKKMEKLTQRLLDYEEKASKQNSENLSLKCENDQLKELQNAYNLQIQKIDQLEDQIFHSKIIEDNKDLKAQKEEFMNKILGLEKNVSKLVDENLCITNDYNKKLKEQFELYNCLYNKFQEQSTTIQELNENLSYLEKEINEHIAEKHKNKADYENREERLKGFYEKQKNENFNRLKLAEKQISDFLHEKKVLENDYKMKLAEIQQNYENLIFLQKKDKNDAEESKQTIEIIKIYNKPQDNNSILCENCKSLKKTLEEKEDLIEKMTLKVLESDNELKNIKVCMNDLFTNFENLEKKLLESKSEQALIENNCDQKLKSLQSYCDNLEKNLHDKDELINNLTEKISKLKEEVAGVLSEKKITEKKNSEILNDQQKQSLEIQKLLLAKDKSLNEIKDKLNHSENEKKIIIAEFEKKIKENEKILNENNQINLKLKEEANHKQIKIQKILNENTTIKSKILESENIITALSLKLENKEKEITSQLLEQEKILKENKNLNEKYSETEQKLKKLYEKLENIEENHKNVTKTLEFENKNLLSELAQQSENIKDLRQKNDESLWISKIEDFDYQIAVLQSQIRKYEQIESNLNKSLVESYEKNKKLSLDLCEQSKTMESILEENKQLKFTIFTKTNDSNDKQEFKTLKMKNIKSEQKIAELTEKIESENIDKAKAVFSSEIAAINEENNKLVKKINDLESFYEKEKESYKKSLDSYAKQLAGASLETNNLKEMISELNSKYNPCITNLTDFDILKAVFYEGKNWYLLKNIQNNHFFWTDSEIQTNLKDQTLELTNEIKNLKACNTKLVEELKKCKNIFNSIDDFCKIVGNQEILKILIEGNTIKSQNSFELLGPTMQSPRDGVLEVFLEELKSARSSFNDFGEDSFGELKSKIISAEQSLFNASSFENSDDIEKLNEIIDKKNKEIKEKAEVIEKYEKIIIELKEKQFRNMLNIEKYNNVKNVIQKFILLNPSDFIYFIQLVRGLCEILEIPISIKKS